MTNEELDTLWFKAMESSIKAGETFVRYQFAALVAAAEREECAQIAEDWQDAIHDPRYQCDCATAIRARGGDA